MASWLPAAVHGDVVSRPCHSVGFCSRDEIDAMFIIGSKIRRDSAEHHLQLHFYAALWRPILAKLCSQMVKAPTSLNLT
jgi:hypothetical protein